MFWLKTFIYTACLIYLFVCQAMKELSVVEKPTVTSTSSIAEAVVAKPTMPRLTNHTPAPTQSQQAPAKVHFPIVYYL